MKKTSKDLINFVISKKGKLERIKYFLKLFIYFIPIIFSLSSKHNDAEASASQAGDDIYPIF
ncbi:MAG: hypothetical protein CFH34_01385 [Alphaproteobacteria bacterium MarineAlpha9_Bin4]|nr:hypothetical protein [Pelagibacterales bacterium]PPR25551.1 MAG: hypothetical protein CFH34_01385 [Alphaproteobacteria bacterium MarineAlpha9_Bin4]|tara:strand:- start:2251 stop:2436 length:186 start_codon:yes stop_codon:yes gene_type:complete